ncbi:hypothetical protein ACB098_05G101200 [Castanea mollissima]|uniref:HMA domain-containing protein n=1 Tax=Castanea mollissima TaxID=60419 RepID=A0A8J4RPM6_9ROSI|nr:hypothetical protein CMV_006255 [Castanea mollissima]
MSIIEMIVHMDCAGCESKIKKALNKLDGVDEVDIDMSLQKVTVMGWVDQEKVLKTVRKTGRRAELWPYPYNPQHQNFIQHNYQPQQQQYHHKSQSVNYYSIPSSSSYKNRKKGYDAQDYGHYQVVPYNYSTVVYDSQASAMFSDENPHACAIM